VSAQKVVVISHGLWEREFGGNSNIVGSAVRLNQHLFTIVGVLPPEFTGVSGGAHTDVWAPLSMHDVVLNYGSYSSRSFRWIQTLARLRPGVSAQKAEAALATLSAQLQKAYPDSNRGVRLELFPLWRAPFGGQSQFLPVLRILLAVSLGVMLIVAANVSCLLLMRAAYREKEIAVRVAIGAGRGRLLRQLSTESLLLAALGGCLGWLIARSAAGLLTRLVPRTSGSFHYHFRLDWVTLAFTFLLTVAAAMLFGLAPALRSSRAGFLEGLKGARGSSQGARQHNALNLLIAGEMAIALVLLVCAGLCLRGFRRARQLDVGFDPHSVLYASLNLVPNGYSAQRAREFDEALRNRLLSLPGVVDAAFVNTPPLGPGGTFSGTVDVEGRAAAAGENRLVSFIIASPGYFPVLRIPLLSGRAFSDADDGSRPNVAIVNQSMARRYWPGLDALGRRFRMAVGIAPTDTFTVIGVAADGKYSSLNEPATPLVYVTYPQRPIASLYMKLLVRTSGDPRGMVSAVRREIHGLDGGVEPLLWQPLDAYIEPAFVPVRVASWLLTILGTAALVLASLGLYGVMAYAVAQRRGEIGIRMALGAQTQDTAALVLKQGLGMAARGAIAGLVASLALTRLLSGFLYGVSPKDPPTFAAAALALMAVAVLASYIPARRAMQVDPITVLRQE
jgi:predicted permease